MVKEITLIAIDTTSTDSIGQIITTEKTSDIMADVSSVSLTEFMSAGQIGLKPDYRLLVWSYEYNGEPNLIMDEVRYSIYRTYKRPDGRTELYVERRSGDE